ncbi:MAG: hypothetical protein BCS36_07110 [Desulfovibrio sp. MES5]|nr:MAG: hypothetical protein BCS36_07110 [Desulfovibrio sp. MES5]
MEQSSFENIAIKAYDSPLHGMAAMIKRAKFFMACACSAGTRQVHDEIARTYYIITLFFEKYHV